MGEALIPDDVRAFLLQHIDSVAQLEALLLLRADPTCTWSAETLTQRLYITIQEATVVLERLAVDGFFTTPPDLPGSYQYQPASGELAAMVDRVAVLYAQYLIPVTHLIHSKPRTRVQEFADAFKLRKGD
ncbi:MAG TPA: hypothetical protein VGX03_07435 [Candidatus Binatia bacterium]|jgi:hypothetical protein|nr:hypothetical protein [Candidatus Binatia bacterium]